MNAKQKGVLPNFACILLNRRDFWRDSPSPRAGIEQEQVRSDMGARFSEMCKLLADALLELEDIRQSHLQVAEACFPDEEHCACVPTLRAEIKRLRKLACCDHGMPWDTDCAECRAADKAMAPLVHKALAASDARKIDAREAEVKRLREAIYAALEVTTIGPGRYDPNERLRKIRGVLAATFEEKEGEDAEQAD